MMANTPCCTARPSYVALLLLGLYVPRAHPLKSSEIGEAIKCELCGVVSRDLFKASIGIQGAGFGPTGFKFKDQYGAGDLIDVVQSICHIEATPDWDEEAQGLPPVALSHGYVLWQNPADGRYTPRRKDDVDESLLGWSMVEAREASDVMFHACEHIRSMDLDVAEQFSVVLRKHRNALKRATVEVDYAFKEVLSQSPEVVKMHSRVCASLCEGDGDSDSAETKKKKKKKKKKKAKEAKTKKKTKTDL